MKNIDGALGFEATLDIDDFNVSVLCCLIINIFKYGCNLVKRNTLFF